MVYEPTPEQIARAQEKRLQRLEKKKQSRPRDEPAIPLFLPRPWISLDASDQLHTAQPVKVMTWNLLAQCLVRASNHSARGLLRSQRTPGSELFPTSGKARKASERIPMLHAEILSHDAEILCMQEVDRLDELLPVLDLAGYSYSYASGADKPHGCLIAYKSTMFRSIHEATREYDELEVKSNPELSTQARIGSSHRTRNIANIVALQSIGPAPEIQGYIIATTHLFWHPAYSYERARQAGLLVREVLACQRLWQLRDWSCIIAGDFNFPPDDPAYSLLVGEPLSLEQQEQVQVSRVVHVSIDPTVSTSVTKEADEGASEADPDKVIRNSRDSKPCDGLLSDTELSSLVGHHLRSAYDEGQRSSLLQRNDIATYGARKLIPAERAGACEPMWTSFTHHWKTTLDYIFILDAPGNRTHVRGYLQPHRTEDVEQGLPRVGISGSDHFSLCAQLVTLPAPSQ